MDNWFTEKLHTENLVFVDKIFRADNINQDEISYDDNDHDFLFELEDASFWFKHRNRIIKEGIMRFPPENNRIIEVGGGNGNTAHYLSQNGFETAMFEPGYHGCANALRRGMENVVCALLSEEHVKRASIEAVGLFDVLEHIDDDEAFLKEIASLLIDDGILYITVPAHMLLWSESDQGHYRRYNITRGRSGKALPAQPPCSRRRRNRKTWDNGKNLRKTIENSGYTVLYETYFFWFLPVLIFLFKTLPYRLKRKKNKIQTDGVKGNDKGFFVAPSFIELIINLLLRCELKRIQKGKRTAIGASIFLAAKKSGRA